MQTFFRQFFTAFIVVSLLVSHFSIQYVFAVDDVEHAWANTIGGTAYSVAVDSSGNVYTTGYFSGTVDFDPGAGTTELTSAGSRDAFISKMNSSGGFVWAKQFGGGDFDQGLSVAIDADGDVYVAGLFSATADFDPGAGTHNLISAGSVDIFVSKLDTNGDFVWAKSMGGISDDYGYGIALDTSGNVYTTGEFKNTVDFDPGAGTYNLSSNGASYSEVFVSKLDTNGDFVWAKSMGGPRHDIGRGIAVDSAGNVYTTGYFTHLFGNPPDFDPGAGTYNLTTFNSADIFVSKLDTNGDFIWAKSMGGSSSEDGNAVALDASGNVYTIGNFAGTVDFDPGAGTFNLTSGGGDDIFVSKLDTNGDFIWAKAMGNANDDSGFGISIDSTGNVYAVGAFDGTVDFDPGAGESSLASNGAYDAFIAKLDTSGDFVWAKVMGGGSGFWDEAYGVHVDTSGNVYTTGYFEGTGDFDPGEGTASLTGSGSGDGFISKLSPIVVATPTPDPTPAPSSGGGGVSCSGSLRVEFQSSESSRPQLFLDRSPIDSGISYMVSCGVHKLTLGDTGVQPVQIGGSCLSDGTVSVSGGASASCSVHVGAAPTPSSVPPTQVPVPQSDLTEGDSITSVDPSDPDIYIINAWGYKRLFLNPIIFSFYGHLGGMQRVKSINKELLATYPTSGLLRNCETDDQKVYAIEVISEDGGTLHHVNISGEQAVTEDLNFFKKVFCANSNELAWYETGSAYTSLGQVPVYSR